MKPDVLRGHLDALILAVVEHEPLHGYAIMEALQQRSGGALDVPTGTLYPALRRLERAGYLTLREGRVEAGALLDTLDEPRAAEAARALVGRHQRLAHLRRRAAELTNGGVGHAED
jgi:hypothetical protein